jgi:hypothetical protein
VIATPDAPASTTAAGFKDWALICAAMGLGRQSIILRKGGLAEGRQGFQFKHARFFLFPTQYHQQAEMVRPVELARLPPLPAPVEGRIEIRYLFELEFAVALHDWETVAALEDFHVYRKSVVRERFEYDGNLGLQCAFGRVRELRVPWVLPDRPAFGGCRSWIQLPPPPETEADAVIDDATHQTRAQALRVLLRDGTFADPL